MHESSSNHTNNLFTMVAILCLSLLTGRLRPHVSACVTLSPSLSFHPSVSWSTGLCGPTW